LEREHCMTLLCRVFADCQRQLGGHENVTPSCQKSESGQQSRYC
jgi:hypothetical protein